MNKNNAKIEFLNVKENVVTYKIKDREETINVGFKADLVRLNNLVDVLDGKYMLLDGVKALIRNDKLNAIFSGEEVSLLEEIIAKNKDNIEDEKLVLYKPHKKRYSKDLVGNIDNDEKIDYLIDVALDRYRLSLRKALSLYKGNETRVKKYFKMAKDINYSEINEEGETPKSNIILTEALYKGINSNYVDKIMEENNIKSDKLYLRLYALITLYYRIHYLKKLVEIENVDYKVTCRVHDELIELFNREVVVALIKSAVTDREYKYEI